MFRGRVCEQECCLGGSRGLIGRSVDIRISSKSGYSSVRTTIVGISDIKKKNPGSEQRSGFEWVSGSVVQFDGGYYWVGVEY